MLPLQTLTRDSISGRLQAGRKSLTPQTTTLLCPQHQSVKGSLYYKCAGSQSDRLTFSQYTPQQTNLLMLFGYHTRLNAKPKFTWNM